MPKLLTRKRNRLVNYDYSERGWYFVTICSKDRKNIFAGGIELSKIGEIINEHWQDIPKQYDNVMIDEYIIMPNHIHGILYINKQDGACRDNPCGCPFMRDGASPSPTISNIIGSFKSRCSVEYLNYVKRNDLNISGQIWQRSFYDHVIRNEDSLNRIREYIIQNPENWENDKNNINRKPTTKQSTD